jgi:hypothetical protein
VKKYNCEEEFLQFPLPSISTIQTEARSSLEDLEQVLRFEKCSYYNREGSVAVSDRHHLKQTDAWFCPAQTYQPDLVKLA